MEDQRRKRNRKRENQGEGCRLHLRQFLASLLFRLMSLPSTPSPAAHPSPARNIAQGDGRTDTPSGSGRCHRHTSPPPRHRSTSNQHRQGSASTVCNPARLVLVLFLQVVRKGSDPARAGHPFPLTLPTLSTLPGKTDSAPPRTSGGFESIFHRPGRTDTQPGYLVWRRSRPCESKFSG